MKMKDPEPRQKGRRGKESPREKFPRTPVKFRQFGRDVLKRLDAGPAIAAPLSKCPDSLSLPLARPPNDHVTFKPRDQMLLQSREGFISG